MTPDIGILRRPNITPMVITKANLNRTFSKSEQVLFEQRVLGRLLPYEGKAYEDNKCVRDEPPIEYWDGKRQSKIYSACDQALLKKYKRM